MQIAGVTGEARVIPDPLEQLLMTGVTAGSQDLMHPTEWPGRPPVVIRQQTRPQAFLDLRTAQPGGRNGQGQQEDSKEQRPGPAPLPETQLRQSEPGQVQRHALGPGVRVQLEAEGQFATGRRRQDPQYIGAQGDHIASPQPRLALEGAVDQHTARHAADQDRVAVAQDDLGMGERDAPVLQLHNLVSGAPQRYRLAVVELVLLLDGPCRAGAEKADQDTHRQLPVDED